MRRSWIWIAVLLALSGAAAGTKERDKLRLEPCTPAGFTEEVLCGSYEVWENRQTKRGGRITLEIVILPATGDAPLPDPVFEFAGGPGDSVIRRAGRWLDDALREQRDILLVDVRGTGQSGALRCDPIETTGPFEQITEFLPEELVRNCRERYKSTDLTQYHTNWIVDDIDEVRAALGYAQLNIIGVSYGTRAASVYMRRHPKRVRSATLYGMAPVDLTMPLSFARDAQLALDGIIDACAKDARCNQAFPDLSGDWLRLIARVDEGPVKTRGRHPDGRELEVEIDRIVLGQTIRYMLYFPPSAYQLPLAVHRAARGDLSLLATHGLFFGNFIGDMSDGLYLSVTCPEDVVHIDEDHVSAAVDGTFLGDYRIRAQQRACELWPHANLPASYREPVRTEVPALIVSGQFDPVTPPYWGERAARHMSNSLHVVVPYAGHDYTGLEGVECVDALAEEFIRRGEVDLLDTSCLSEIRHPPFALALETELDISAEQLAQFAGTFRSKMPPLELRFEVREGSLFVEPPGMGQFIRLESVEENVFRPAGIPVPIRLRFTADGAGLELDEEGSKIEFRRAEP